MLMVKNYLLIGVLMSLLLSPGIGYSAMEGNSGDHEKHGHGGSPSEMTDMDMPNEFAEMRAKGARLESALDQNHQGKMMGQEEGHGMAQAMNGPGMGMMKSSEGKGMGMKGGMGMNKMGMMGMGKMMMKKTDAESEVLHPDLPAFPGAAHLYHVGATNHFIDYADHINLIDEQRKQIQKIQESASANETETNLKIETAEQELWELTSSDQPNILEIEKKVREIEKIKADHRLAFIHSVGDAAKTLSDEQRKAIMNLINVAETENGKDSNL